MGLYKRLKLFRTIIVVLIVIFFVFFLLSRGINYHKTELVYGLTFSHKQAIDLGLDWQEVYIAILDDLETKKLRISAYWDVIEAERGTYDFEYLDWQVSEAEKRGVELVMAVGGRLPRWPECHYPEWAKQASKSEREDAILKYIEATVNRYKKNQSVKLWQVENEPFLPHFGECPKLDSGFLDQEIALVKELDSREILLTDSGELSLWVPAAKRADIFGTTMYRDTYSSALKSYVHYPIEPGFFHFKKNMARLFAKPKKWIVIELQAEPWGPIPFQYLPKEEREITMSEEKLRDIVEFSSKTGFREFYLWGVEWWYWEKTKQNNPSLWEEAKKLYQI